MHYKDGTPAVLGDIVQHDNGSVGILIGGMMGSDFCSTQIVMFKGLRQHAAGASGIGQSYTGLLRDPANKVVDSATVIVATDSYAQTRECVKIGHVGLGI